MSANGAKVFKRGEAIYKEGEKASALYLIQAGQVSLQVQRAKPIEIFIVGNGQVIGDHALTGLSSHPHTAIAVTEVRILELPLEAVKAQVEGASQILKVMAKSLADRAKLLHNELKSIRLERDSQACPPDQLAKILATVFHVARTKGKVEKDGSTHVSWILMKQYAQRLFLESPKRLEAAITVFVKLNQASFVMQKNEEEPDQPEEIGTVIFKDLNLIEWVFEHWQYYYFKGGKTDILKTDEKVMQVVAALVDYAQGLEADRNGVVRIDFATVVERFKSESGIVLNADYFGIVEQKGLFVKRHPTDQGVQLQYEILEFTRWSRIWTVLKEIERWNEKGFVDTSEPAFDPRKFQKASGGPTCSACGTPYEAGAKFCSECGQKVVAAA